MAKAPTKQPHSEDSDNLSALAASEAPGVIDALDRNRTKILITIAAIAVGFCVVLVVNQLKRQRHIDAAMAYTSAVSKGEIAALDGVIVDFPGTVAAGNALLSKADLQIEQGKQDDARATLERFISEFKSHPRYAQGVFALANLFHLAGDKEMAKSHYEKVIEIQKKGEFAPLALIRLGDLALESGDLNAADQRYQESYTLHPGNAFFDYAQDKLALLKVGNPPEIEKPAPPAPKEEAKTETPATKADAPAPKADAPAAPKADAPKPAAPKADAPAAPKADAPKPAAPKAETPAAPKADAPKPAAPKTDAPAAPKADAPKPAAPKADAPAAPKADAPKPAAPKAETPAAPKADAPKPAAPKADAPAAPKADAPVAPAP